VRRQLSTGSGGRPAGGARAWAEGLAWISLSGVAVFVLLVSLLVWVDAQERAESASSAGGEASPVRLEPARPAVRGGAASTVSVPLVAVLRDDQLRPYCFVAVADAHGRVARRRTLELDAVRGSRVLVRRGLHPGDAVLVHGHHGVRAGDRVVELGAGAVRLAEVPVGPAN